MKLRKVIKVEFEAINCPKGKRHFEKIADCKNCRHFNGTKTVKAIGKFVKCGFK